VKPVTIGRDILGTKKSLRFDGQKYSWVDEPNMTDVCIGCGDLRNLQELYEIFFDEIPDFVPNKYKQAFKTINASPESYMNLMPLQTRKLYKSHVSSILENVQNFLDEEYVKHFYIGQKFLNRLRPCHVDLQMLSEIKDKIPKSNTFEVIQGRLRRPVYCRNGSSTGRLTIKSGPSILTMKKEYRKIVLNARQVDFSSMEPRLLLATQGKFPEGDLYDWISREAGLNGSRAQNKVSILASLYGSKNSIQKVDEVFSLKETFEKLNSSVEDETIRNFYGRPVKVKDSKDHKLLSLWLQSSAVDAALIGFYNLFNNSKLVPHWVIHDACIFTGNEELPTYLDIGKGITLPVETSEI